MLKLNDFHKQRMQDEERKRRRTFSAAGGYGNATLDENLIDGLQDAVNGSRTRLALEYLYAIILGQQAQIEELQAALASTPEPVKPSEPESKPEAKKKTEPKKTDTDATVEEDV